jgi:hypothetical protein
MDEGIKKLLYYIQWNIVQSQRRMKCHSQEVDRTKEHHVEQYKLEPKRQILHVLSHVCILDLETNK